MGWRGRVYAITKLGIYCGPLSLTFGNTAFGTEFELALERKYHGATVEERIRGAADFALMSDYSSAEEKARARATLARMDG